MARPTDPRQEAALQMLTDPARTYAEVSEHFDVDVTKLRLWASRARRAGRALPERGTIPPPSVRAAIRRVRPTPAVTRPLNLVVLPVPTTPVTASAPAPDKDLVVLARDATRAALLRLTAPGAFDKESVRDTASVLSMLTDKYNLLPAVDGKATASSAESTPRRVVDSLMGVLGDPDEDAQNDHEKEAESPADTAINNQAREST